MKSISTITAAAILCGAIVLAGAIENPAHSQEATPDCKCSVHHKNQAEPRLREPVKPFRQSVDKDT